MILHFCVPVSDAPGKRKAEFKKAKSLIQSNIRDLVVDGMHIFEEGAIRNAFKVMQSFEHRFLDYRMVFNSCLFFI